jgi:hypothetical protein
MKTKRGKEIMERNSKGEKMNYEKIRKNTRNNRNKRVKRKDKIKK